MSRFLNMYLNNLIKYDRLDSFIGYIGIFNERIDFVSLNCIRVS